MPRLLLAEESKPRLHQLLLVTAGIMITCYGLLTAASSLLPFCVRALKLTAPAARSRFGIEHAPPTANRDTRSAAQSARSARGGEETMSARGPSRTLPDQGGNLVSRPGARSHLRRRKARPAPQEIDRARTSGPVLHGVFEDSGRRVAERKYPPLD
jgi:hypothetical protein